MTLAPQDEEFEDRTHRVVCRETGGLVGSEICQEDPAP